jgi:hypothetical protein
VGWWGPRMTMFTPPHAYGQGHFFFQNHPLTIPGGGAHSQILIDCPDVSVCINERAQDCNGVQVTIAVERRRSKLGQWLRDWISRVRNL